MKSFSKTMINLLEGNSTEEFIAHMQNIKDNNPDLFKPIIEQA